MIKLLIDWLWPTKTPTQDPHDLLQQKMEILEARLNAEKALQLQLLEDAVENLSIRNKNLALQHDDLANLVFLTIKQVVELNNFVSVLNAELDQMREEKKASKEFWKLGNDDKLQN